MFVMRHPVEKHNQHASDRQKRVTPQMFIPEFRAETDAVDKFRADNPQNTPQNQR